MSKLSSSSVNPVTFVINESPKFKICGDKFNAVDNIEPGRDEGLEAGLEFDLDLGMMTIFKFS